MDTAKDITFDDLTEYLNKHYELVYVEYNDSLDNNLDDIQEALHTRDMCELYDKESDWFDESEWDSVNQILDDLKNTRGNARASRPDERHPKGPGPLQGLFHLGHDVERLVVGVEKKFEQMVAVPEGQAKLFRALRLRFGASSKKRCEAVNDSQHNTPLLQHSSTPPALYTPLT